MKTWHFYSLETGAFTGASFSGREPHLAVNVPAGCGAFEGVLHPMSQRVDLVTGQLVDMVPASPDDGSGLYLWSWDPAVKCWVGAPTLLKLKADAWAAIKAARDAETDAPLVTDLGTYDHDAASRQAILNCANGAAVTSMDVAMTLADDSTVRLQPRQIATVLALSHTRVQSVREIATALRAEIDQADSPAAVAAITWPAPVG